MTAMHLNWWYFPAINLDDFYYFHSMTHLSISIAVFLFVCVTLSRIQPTESFRNAWKAAVDNYIGRSIDSPSKLLQRNGTLFRDSFLNLWFEDPDDVRSSSEDEEDEESATAEITHFCFLLHGINGFSKDLAYVRQVMRRRASKVLKQKGDQLLIHDSQTEDDATSCASEDLSASHNDTPDTAHIMKVDHDMVVHACVCNERKTADGIEAGGDRLVEEIISVIRSKMQSKQSHRKHKELTISILGNSLGGIYGRYAIAKLLDRCINLPDGSCILDDKFRLHLNVFCTTATPHLGVAGHTFFPLPRQAEIGLGHAMGKTGKDIFRITPLLEEMATSPYYLEPLGRFRKRIAFANAFRTDFPVPVHTAAFLSENSDYPHHFEEQPFGSDSETDNCGMFLAAAHTPQKSKFTCKEDCSVASADEYDEVVAMSNSLDALGWKKVFVDMRQQVPRLAIPTALLRKNTNSSSSIRTLFCQARSDSNRSDETGLSISDESERSDTDLLTVDPITQLKQRRIVGSREVAEAMKAPVVENVFHWPIGHNMIVAFSRNRVSTYFNRGGRPIVDALAKELVDDIFAWRPISTEEDSLQDVK
jgi:hypothetical protein